VQQPVAQLQERLVAGVEPALPDLEPLPELSPEEALDD
jgi:hypothetical protein